MSGDREREESVQRSSSTKSLIINVLVALLGMSAGVGLSHISIISNLHAAQVKIAEHDLALNYLKDGVEATNDHHTQTLELMRELVNQNNILIQQTIVNAPTAQKRIGGG